ncbi:MAG TPA: hypothetical protein VIZ58_05635, partial [Thermoanaerobaculia bacterium]
MKAVLSVVFTLLLTASVFGETPEFQLQEPISLDLKDAKVTEVITLLGALAHLPVSIDPSIQGSVTIRLLDVPYEVALRKISEPLDFTLKIEGGKLVATPRHGAAAPETRAAAAANRLPDSPRIPVEDYRGAFRDLTPLYLRWRSAGSDHCARMTFASGPTYDADGAAVTQFGWDPVTRTRLIAVDGPDRLRAVAVAEPPALPGKLVFGDALALLPQEPSSGPCPDAGGHVAKGTPEMVFLRVDEIREDGSRFALAVPRMLVRP